MNDQDFILIIEDDADIRETLKYFLEVEGFNSQTAINGKDGLNFLNESQKLPRLILTDHMMPVLDGMKFREMQLADERLALIPVILLSADRQAPMWARKMGVNECVQKPIDLNSLFGIIRKVWE